MDLADFKSVTIPQDDSKLGQLAKRCKSARPLGMFRSNPDEFLLCYNEFGLYVDSHGDPVPGRSIQTVEWEATADRVALHAPYILLFSSRFIEIRRIETGHLVQIIPGSELRCLWAERGTPNAPPLITGLNVDVSQLPRVHGVMNGPEITPQAGQSPVAQHVFELIPVIPL